MRSIHFEVHHKLPDGTWTCTDKNEARLERAIRVMAKRKEPAIVFAVSTNILTRRTTRICLNDLVHYETLIVNPDAVDTLLKGS